MLNNVTVGLVRGALRIMRAACFYIRRTLSSSILLHDVPYYELAYIVSGSYDRVKVNDSLILFQV